jgi:hypothetical protein
MSNLPATSEFKLSERVSIVGTITRAESKLLARQLFGNIASCATKVSATAAHDDFVQKCVSLAISEMVEGDHSRLDRFEAYAKTLPEYKEVKRNGMVTIAGKLGDLIRAYRQAVSYGAMVRQHADFKKTDDVINLAFWLGESASFGALIAPPAQRVAIAKPTTAPTTAPTSAPTSAPISASKLHALAVDRNWFDRSLNHCDSAGYFNPMTAAVEFSAKVEAAKVEAAAKLPQTLVGMFAQLFADQPEQAVRHLAEMAQIAGYTIRKTSAKVAKAA